ncbi:DUF4465 domain-containing protein, partial [Myroides odoratimimus]|uniref:DUF4465 domain-containing protein n=1 Tax=Myroides odoratimimus TaxID=76832 RepID=UPI002578C7E2
EHLPHGANVPRCSFKCCCIYLLNLSYRKEVDKVNMDWQKVNLEKLTNIKYLVFYIDSSDKGEWGVNTPAYFTAKNLTVYKTN